MGMPATPLDDQVYAFASDIGPGNQVAVVYFPTGLSGAMVVTDSPFGDGAATTVPLLADMGNAWTNAAEVDCVGPFNVGNVNTEHLHAH
jgi:hypothetical protein